MVSYTLSTIDGEPSEQDMKIVTEGMLAYHAENGHSREEKVISVPLRDASEVLVGIGIGRILWGRMHIRSLWVHESIRHMGWGRKLMERLEAEAVKHGCTHAYTDTFSYQAPDFYQKLGYTEYARMDDYPPGSSLHYLIKQLV